MKKVLLGLSFIITLMTWNLPVLANSVGVAIDEIVQEFSDQMSSAKQGGNQYGSDSSASSGSGVHPGYGRKRPDGPGIHPGYGRKRPGGPGIHPGYGSDRTFHSPNHPRSSRRLDWCLYYGRDCGFVTADAFCREQGYSSANNIVAPVNRGSTRTLGDNRNCNGGSCGSFASITCTHSTSGSRAPRSDMMVYYPKTEGYALDYCLSPGERCGQETADRYCHREGYRGGATDFSSESTYETTQYINSGTRCYGNCTTFSYINCRG